MIITFKELGINPSDYNGLSYEQSHALIVNIACDYIIEHHMHMGAAGFYMTEQEAMPSIDKAFTNFILGTVYVPTAWDAAPKNVSMDGWTLISYIKEVICNTNNVYIALSQILA